MLIYYFANEPLVNCCFRFIFLPVGKFIWFIFHILYFLHRRHITCNYTCSAFDLDNIEVIDLDIIIRYDDTLGFMRQFDLQIELYIRQMCVKMLYVKLY